MHLHGKMIEKTVEENGSVRKTFLNGQLHSFNGEPAVMNKNLSLILMGLFHE